MADRRSIRTDREAPMLFPTTIAGSLPKPEWLAQPNTLWAPWKSKGDELARAKRDATLLAVKLQEDSGIDIVTEGEQARQHFVHGFLENIEGIDFAHKVEMGIRNDRYKAMVPQVVAPLKLRGRVHADESRVARTHTAKKVKFTLPGPMTIIDTIADKYYGDRVKMAFAFAELLNKVVQAGVIDVASDEVETAEDVVKVIEDVAKFVPKANIVATTNCGMAPMRREIAEAKLMALGAGARLARHKLA